MLRDAKERVFCCCCFRFFNFREKRFGVYKFVFCFVEKNRLFGMMFLKASTIYIKRDFFFFQSHLLVSRESNITFMIR